MGNAKVSESGRRRRRETCMMMVTLNIRWSGSGGVVPSKKLAGNGKDIEVTQSECGLWKGAKGKDEMGFYVLVMQTVDPHFLQAFESLMRGCLCEVANETFPSPVCVSTYGVGVHTICWVLTRGCIRKGTGKNIFDYRESI